MSSIKNDEGFVKISNWIVNVFINVAERFGILYTPSTIGRLVVQVCGDQIINDDLQLYGQSLYLNSSNEEKIELKFKLFNVVENTIEKHIIDSMLIAISYYKKVDDLSNYIDSCENDDTVFLSLINSVETKAKELIEKKIDKVYGEQLELIKALSNARYEKNNCNGNIVFCNNSDIDCISIIAYGDISKRIYFKKKNKKIIRKLLEVATETIALCLVKDYNEKYYYIKGYVNKKVSDSVSVRIHGLKSIDFYVGDKLSIRYVDGDFCKKSSFVLTNEDVDNINSFFKVGSNIEKDKAYAITEYAEDIWTDKDHFHGAIIIVTNDNDFIDHMFRFDRGIVPESGDLNLFGIYNDSSCDATKKELLKRISNIDGAVIFDNDGNLRMYGAILDGVARDKAQMESGSRFNSVKTFVDHYSHESNGCSKYLAIVMSENGPVKVFYK